MTDRFYQYYYSKPKATNESYDLMLDSWYKMSQKSYIKQIQMSKRRIKIENDDFQFTFNEKLDKDLDQALSDYGYYKAQKLDRGNTLKFKKMQINQMMKRDAIISKNSYDSNFSEYKDNAKSTENIPYDIDDIDNQVELEKTYEGDLILSEIGLYEALRYDYTKLIPFLVIIRCLLQLLVLFEVPGGDVSNIKTHEIVIL